MKISNSSRAGLVLLALLGLLALVPSAGWPRAAQYLSPKSLENPDRAVPLSRYWLYQPGDSLAWAEPAFDDGKWPEASPSFDADDPPAGWTGIGWFRLHLNIDGALWEVPLSLSITQLGAAEFYLDGRRVYSLGAITPSAMPGNMVHYCTEFPDIRPITFGMGSHHVLAVRLQSRDVRDYFDMSPCPQGFSLSLHDPAVLQAKRTTDLSKVTTYHAIFGTAPLTIAFLHLLLFLFQRKVRAHLYYAVFSVSTAALAYLPLHYHTTSNLSHLVALFHAFSVVLVLTSLSGMRFLYAIFMGRIPRVFWLWVVLGALSLALCWRGPSHYTFIFTLASFIEITRVVIIGIRSRKRDAKLIGYGTLAFIGASAYQITVELLTGAASPSQSYVYLYGLMVMVISMSIYLALTHARISSDLEIQLDQVKELSAKTIEQERRAKEQEVERMRLEAENAMKAKELEEARKRQRVLDELETAHRVLRETQSQLIQSEKMAALGTLVAGVAHEINTPVGAISSMHDTLVRAMDKLKTTLRETSPSELEKNGVLQNTFKLIEDANAVIESGSHRVTSIVRRLRSFARLDEAELKRADVREGIEDTLVLVHHELKHDVTVNRNYGDVPPIPCYPGQLNQVFLNMLINARQAIKGKGEITITTYQREGQVCIEFSDNGAGIPPENISRIFDPGFTTKGVGVGTGLGLSICYQIISAHRGEIKVRSEVDKGTTFTITLPMNLDQIIGEPIAEEKGSQA